MSSTARRPMSVALKTAELSGEALEFIRQGKPGATASPEPDRVNIASSEITDSSATTAASEQRSEETSLPRRSPASKRVNAIRETMVGLSFRVPASIHHALMCASFDRKLAREEPWTQQEIAAEAIGNWLKKQGFL